MSFNFLGRMAKDAITGHKTSSTTSTDTTANTSSTEPSNTSTQGTGNNTWTDVGRAAKSALTDSHPAGAGTGDKNRDADGINYAEIGSVAKKAAAVYQAEGGKLDAQTMGKEIVGGFMGKNSGEKPEILEKADDAVTGKEAPVGVEGASLEKQMLPLGIVWPAQTQDGPTADDATDENTAAAGYDEAQGSRRRMEPSDMANAAGAAAIERAQGSRRRIDPVDTTTASESQTLATHNMTAGFPCGGQCISEEDGEHGDGKAIGSGAGAEALARGGRHGQLLGCRYGQVPKGERTSSGDSGDKEENARSDDGGERPAVEEAASQQKGASGQGRQQWY